MDTLGKEVETVAEKVGSNDQIHTIFFGGGTPSLIPVKNFEHLLQIIYSNYVVESDVEITLEANPGTVTEGYLQELKGLGFTRISYGMQSADAHDLWILERQHDFEQVKQCVAWTQAAGFRHINVDLIFGIPGQTLQSWKDSLNSAIKLGVDHLSLYSLTIEKDTPLERAILRGDIKTPDGDLAASMYEYAMDLLPGEGFSQYEVSNWSSGRGSRSRHNLQYWLTEPYLGFGAGAHGFYGHKRMENKPGIMEYIRSVNESHQFYQFSPAELEVLKLTPWGEMQEFLMLGFRLTEEGVSKTDFTTRFSYNLDALFSKQLDTLFSLKLIEPHPLDADRLRLTRKGILFGNRVFEQFVANKKPDWFRDQDQ